MTISRQDIEVYSLEKYRICSRHFVNNEPADLVAYIASWTFKDKHGAVGSFREMGECKKKKYAGDFNTTDGYHYW